MSRPTLRRSCGLRRMDTFADMIEDTLGPQSHYSGWVRGPRWMGIPNFIRQEARVEGLELIRMNVKKRFFYMKANYVVRGPERKVDAFRAKVKAALTYFGALEQG